MSQRENKPEMVSQGVEALINKLKTDGVLAGEKAADDIIKQAQAQANKILQAARTEVTQLTEDAFAKIQQEKKAVEDALQLAARNMRLDLRQRLIDRFKEEVERLVHIELTQEATLKQLILILTLDTADQLQKFKEKEIEIILPASVLNFEAVRDNPKLLENDPLKKLVQQITHKMLREGMNVKINPEDKDGSGIKVHVVGENIEMDLTERAVSELLLKHMQPRFRALLEGLLQ